MACRSEAIILYCLVFSFFCVSVVYAGENCQLFSAKKGSQAFLLDKSKALSSGPIDFGVHRFYGSDRDEYSVPTQYTLITSPRKNKLLSAGSLLGFLRLREVASPCANTRSFEMYYIIRIKDTEDHSWLPMNVNDDSIGLPDFEDLGRGDGTAKFNLNFELRVIGRIVDGRKK